MSIIAELLNKPGVIAAGQYTFRGDRFSYRGELSDEQARMVSIICRTTTMATRMGGKMLAALAPQCRVQPTYGWAVRGPGYALCVVANTFCFVDNRGGSLNTTLSYMREALAHEPMDLV